MDELLSSFGRLFTDLPFAYLSWPALAMILGWLLAAASKSTATALALTPRTANGLIGLLSAPFIHANFAHLSANLPPFLVLGVLVLRRDTENFLGATLSIALVQGSLLWLLGRRAAHVGMSGVIFGFFGYLVTTAWYTRTTPDLLIAGGVLVFYGGMLAGIAPARNGTSWEGHALGLLAGLGQAWFEYAAH